MIDFLSQNVQLSFVAGTIFGMLLMWAIEDDLGNHRKGARA